ncbi:MAG: TIGR03986 family CRISPR-associated RAMP protein [Acidobacteriota bacterium]
MGILNLPQHENPKREDRKSTAPYNFIPLPETVVTVAENDPENLPGHDSYEQEKHPHTGYFDVTLITQSPLYVRGMLTRDEFDLDEQGLDRHGLDADGKDADGNQVREGRTPLVDRLKNNPDFFHIGNGSKPVIPGSSLRGMLRSVVEIISHSKFGPMSRFAKISFRAVAAPSDDPLSEPYDNILGRNGRNVEAGYLVKVQGKWKIRRAKNLADLGLLGRGAYLKVKDSQRVANSVSGLKRFDNNEYLPQFRSVSFETETQTDRQGYRYSAVANISSDLSRYELKGGLVCSGNMLETGSGGGEVRRTNYALVPQPDLKADLVEISDDAIRDYIDCLTPFLKTPPSFHPINGCLTDYQPVFYVQRDGVAICFGHCPNFRVPAFLKGTYRAATPADFLPPSLGQPSTVDFADAIFGYVEKKRPAAKQGSRSNAYAGRVTVTDASTTDTDLFLPNSPFSPSILATPKPTAFQHYLTQKSELKSNLKHYGSSPNYTTIRGYKRYWPQGDKTAADLNAKQGSPGMQEDGNVEPTSTQHTLVRPMRSGVSFRFRVYFENLSSAELGALCWALHPLGVEGKTYCHQLGMGKPLGMGAVTLDATLQLNQRKARYESLFVGDAWATGDETEQPLPLATGGEQLKGFTDAFEQEVLKQLGKPCARLSQLKRIAMLLKMMDWEDRRSDSEVETQSLDDFRQRKVLPDPSAWIPDAKNLAVPQPTEEPIVSSDPRSSNQRQASSSGLGNSLTLPIQPPPPPSVTPKPKLETVTLAGNINAKKRAQVNIDGVEITCEGMPSTAYGAPVKGETIQAMVTRAADGKPIAAKYQSK